MQMLAYHGCHRSGNSQGKKNSSRSGKSQGISLWVRENLHLWKKSGKSEILRVLIYLLPSQWYFCMVKNASCQSILFPCYVKELSVHVHCVCLAESINKWVERMAVRGGWRPLSGLICEIVHSVGQGNFTFVREKSGKSQGISNTYGCGNHDWAGIEPVEHWWKASALSTPPFLLPLVLLL